MKKKLYISAVLALGLMSCDSNNGAKAEAEQQETAIVEEVKSQTPHELELNNGEKWLVDEGMTEAMESIKSYLASFDSNDVTDYQVLGGNIGDQTKKIIRSCTMKGKGHDELHKWLLPFLDLKKALVRASSPEEGAALLKKINKEVDIYHQYFK